MRVAIYTACFGDYDRVIEPVPQSIEVDWLLWGTEREGWKSQQTIIPDLSNDALNSRAVKILSHWHLPTYDYVIWMDSAMHIKSPDFAAWCIEHTDKWGMCKHPWRTTAMSEAKECIRLGYYVNPASLERQTRSNFPDQVLYAAGLMCRKPKEPVVQSIENHWMTEVLLSSPRDQISLPFCFWKNNFTPSILPSDVFKGPHHKYGGHRKGPRRKHVVRIQDESSSTQKHDV